jgi:hypothetical protein
MVKTVCLLVCLAFYYPNKTYKNTKLSPKKRALGEV